MKQFDKLQLDRTLLAAGKRVCCAVSGGADSIALLLALLEVNAEKQPLGIVLSALHVHHGLRGAEADADEAFVRQLCEQRGIPLTVARVDTAARQAAEREGLEEAARELRYRVFGELLDNDNADLIATAHTLDDQAETVVMKLLRGAWTEGLGGISPSLEAVTASRTHHVAPAFGHPGEKGRDFRRVVRPLLGIRRADIEAFLTAQGQTWREDSSNRDLSLTRNRVRRELMPILRSYNPRVDEALANISQIARDEEAFWGKEVNRILPQVLLPGRPVRGGGRAVSTAAGEKSCSIEVDRLRSMEPALRRRVIRAAARSLGSRLSFEETAKLLALAGFGGHQEVMGKIGSQLELRDGFRAERSPRELRLWKQAAGRP